MRTFAIFFILSFMLVSCAPAEPSPLSAPRPSAQADARTGVTPEHEPEPEISPEQVEPDRVGELLAGMSLEEKLWQMIVAAPEDLTGSGAVTQPDALAGILDTCPVGGLVLFRGNIKDPEQARGLISGAQAASKTPLFVCVDEEGGNVSRLSGTLGTTKFEPMFNYRSEGTETARKNAETLGRDILSFGFNVDFAPVADVWSNSENTVIGTRAYSNDPDEAAELVAAAVEGFHEAGIMCTLKHFPGHGDTVSDSHTGAAVVELSREEIERTQLPPFIAGIDAGADAVMVGHLTVPALDTEPATVSVTIVTDLLRGELGFDGVVITDALGMSAVSELYGPGELAVRAIQAGVDMLLMPDSLEETLSALEEALDSGELTEARIDESVRRILELKVKYGLIGVENRPVSHVPQT